MLGVAVFFVGLYFVVRAAAEHGIECGAEEIDRKQREAVRNAAMIIPWVSLCAEGAVMRKMCSNPRFEYKI